MKTIRREPPLDLSAVRQSVSTRKRCAIASWAIVLGGAECVWEDVSRWEYGTYGASWPAIIVAANDIGCHFPDVDHWASFHVDKFKGWMQLREAKGYARPRATWGWRVGHPVDYVVSPWSGGSSGMLATQVALALGCSKVILCGMPMTATAHFPESQEFDANQTVWSESDGHWRSWVRVHEEGWFEGRVRSMSGRTRQLLGEPTREWLLK